MKQSSCSLCDRQTFDRGGLCGDGELFHFVVSGHLNVDPFTLNLKKSHCPHKMATFLENIHSWVEAGWSSVRVGWESSPVCFIVVGSILH